LASAQKLESIGQLAAGIAHEINTPTQFIGDNIRFLQQSVGDVLSIFERLLPLMVKDDAATISAAEIAAFLQPVDVDYLREEVPKAIVQSLEGVERIAKIVGAMKEFSHPAVDKAPHDLNRAIASTVTVASNEWKYVADVETDFDADLPLAPVMLGAFNQVILNMLVNAAHAVGAVVAEAPGTRGMITISTRKVEDWAEIRIQDSGCGISEAVRDRIFDPFFTTKEVGKGTGQGLAIAHDVIVNKHKGTLTVESAVGLGTTFTLRLPLQSVAPDSAAAA
jgi:signal transduction histidine kinase